MEVDKKKRERKSLSFFLFSFFAISRLLDDSLCMLLLYPWQQKIISRAAGVRWGRFFFLFLIGVLLLSLQKSNGFHIFNLVLYLSSLKVWLNGGQNLEWIH